MKTILGPAMFASTTEAPLLPACSLLHGCKHTLKGQSCLLKGPFLQSWSCTSFHAQSLLLDVVAALGWDVL